MDVRYHEPMYVHCGMEWLWVGDGTWRRTDDGPGVETGAGQGAPEDWPLAEAQQTLYGYATVRADGTMEYSLEDGTIIATYERRNGAPGCERPQGRTEVRGEAGGHQQQRRRAMDVGHGYQARWPGFGK
ncbi:hypothetical protein D0Z08_11995 [Nocardioides immobilis]|uniref:Uncharacterized protein n=1 Tax=Nocardioides immobilis TaxID=2049295 RepID=A0A417Y2L9_9ACTN|nr:hypothetical protein [Nocardioides immobilis]RHW26908.1 hypothetical protein D0Z08_11995 [Nocardioides immobilis]